MYTRYFRDWYVNTPVSSCADWPIDPQVDLLPLHELAASWMDVKAEIFSCSPIRIAHLVKLFYYKCDPMYEQNFKGWVASARKGLEQVPMLKGFHKRPSKEKLYEMAWDSWVDSIEDLQKGIIEELNETYIDFQKITVLDIKGLISFGNQVYWWLCETLSCVGKVEQDKVEEKVKELLRIG